MSFASKILVFIVSLSFLASSWSLSAQTPPSPLEIQRMAEAETKAAFNPEYKAKIKAESLEKYPDVDVGDKLTVPMRMGASFVDREGTLRSVGVDYIKVNFGGANDVKILKVDLNPDIRAAIEGDNKLRRADYFARNFTVAMAQYKKAATDRLYTENGYVFDPDSGSWRPKFKPEEPRVAAKAKDAAPVDGPITKITTISGEVFTDVSIQKIDSDSVEILHSGGAATIKFSMLTEALRKRLAPASGEPGKAAVAEKSEKASKSEADSVDSGSALTWSDGSSSSKDGKNSSKDNGERLSPGKSAKEAAFISKAEALLLSKAVKKASFKVVENGETDSSSFCRFMYSDEELQSRNLPPYFMLAIPSNRVFADFEVYRGDLFWAGTLTFRSKTLKRTITLNVFSPDREIAMKRVRKAFKLFDENSPGFNEGGEGSTSARSFDDDDEDPKSAGRSKYAGVKAFGSGFIISPEGFAVTNYHVVKGASRIKARAEGGTFSAKLVGQDLENDLAIIKIDAPSKLVPALFSPDKVCKAGQTIFTIGFPAPTALGFNPKITKGVVSALSGFSDDIRFYQIDASVQPGNSGGPLADAAGHLVGVVAARINDSYFKNATGSAPQNINYAIKKSYLMAFIENQSALGSKIKWESAKDSAPIPFEEAVEKLRAATVQILIY